MFVGEEPFLPLTLVEVGDVHELEGTGSEGQVGVVALDSQINARAMDQVGNQDILQHIHIVFAPVETHHHQLGEVVMQVGQQSFPFFIKRLVVWTGAAGKASGRRSYGNWRSTRR